MIRAALATIGLCALTSCTGSERMMQDGARNTAKSVVAEAAVQRFPGVDVVPFTDCIIDNASDQDILNIASGAVTGPDESTVQIILNIASRPETAACIGPVALAQLAR